MRTLSEIIDDCIEEKMPSHEECYLALQVYRRMLNMDHTELRRVLLSGEPKSEWARKGMAETSFLMYKGALSKSPKEWLEGSK